jgi:protein O-mannosyl-transferase
MSGPCPCGSGLKYKRCCFPKARSVRTAANADVVSRRSPQFAWALLAIAIVTVVVFLPSLKGGFVWDDKPNFLDNPHFRGFTLENLKWIFAGSIRKGNYEPVSWLILECTYTFAGMSAGAYHLTGLFLHVLSALMFFLVARKLLSLSFSPTDNQAGVLTICAAAASILFSIHPLRVEVVAWVSGQHYASAGIFFLASIYCYLSATAALKSDPIASRHWYWSSVAAFALSLLSFPIGMMLPVVLLGMDFYPLSRFDVPQDQRWAVMRTLLVEKIPFVALTAAIVIATFVGRLGLHDIAPLEGHGIGARALVSTYGATLYLIKTAFPFNLAALYEMPPVVSFGVPKFAGGLLAVVALTAIFFSVRKRFPLILAVWLYYLITLLPVSGLAQSGPQVAADRYTYLSCLGWPIVVAAAMFQALQSRAVFFRRLSIAIMSMIVVSLGVCTWRLTSSWHDEVSLWSRVVAVDPDSRIGNFSLGRSLDDVGRVEEAVKSYTRATEIDPTYMDPHFNLGSISQREGRLVEAVEQFETVIRLKPDYAYGYFFLGNTLEKQKRPEAALDAYRQALVLTPHWGRVDDRIGALMVHRGMLPQALAYYQDAISADPRDAAALNSIGAILAGAGKLDEAIASIQRAIEINPNYALAHQNLGNVYRLKNQPADAAREFQLAAHIGSAQNSKTSDDPQ